MDARTLELADWIRGALAEVPEVERVLVYGSRARGDNGPRSDLDIAVEAPKADVVSWQRILDLIEEAPTLVRIDVVRLDTATGDIREEIERDGVRIDGEAARAP